MLRRLLLALSVSAAGAFATSSAVHAQETNSEPSAPLAIRNFIEQNCFDCHQGESSEAGLDLAALTKQADQLTIANSEKWVRIFDRVHNGEMPPTDYGTPDSEELKSFLDQTENWIAAAQQSEMKEVGRVQARRLTNLQLERTLHDLLGVDIPLAKRMPDEPRTEGFNTVADGQPMSHFQLEQHVDVVDTALDEAFRRAMGKSDLWKKKIAAKNVARRRSQRRNREPEFIKGQAVVWTGRLP